MRGCHTQRSMVVEVPLRCLTKSRARLCPAVEKIVKSWVPDEPANAQIVVLGADHFMAIENTMVNAEGETVSLKPGAEVDVVIEAAVEDTIEKSDPPLAVRSA